MNSSKERRVNAVLVASKVPGIGLEQDDRTVFSSSRTGTMKVFGTDTGTAPAPRATFFLDATGLTDLEQVRRSAPGTRTGFVGGTPGACCQGFVLNDAGPGPLPDKQRPVLLLTRTDMIPLLNTVAVARLTRTIRGVASEVVAGPEAGIKEQSAIKVHHVVTIPRAGLCRFVGSVSDSTMAHVRAALLFALGWDEEV